MIIGMKKKMAKLLVDIPDSLMKKIRLRVDLEGSTIKKSVTDTLEKEYGNMTSKDRENLNKIFGTKSNVKIWSDDK